MKNLLYLLAILFVMNSCSKDEGLLKPAILDKPSRVNVFCQGNPNDTLRVVVFEYNNDNLISETTFRKGEIQSKNTFEYNANNQLIFEFTEAGSRTISKTYIYNNANQLINIKSKTIDRDINGQIINESESEAPKEYENNKLVKEWASWGGFSTFEHSGDKAVKQISHTKNGEQHHITSFKYSGDLLIEEKKETKAGKLIFFKTYKYDAQNRLVQIKDGENIIEENDYLEKRLIEKRTYYFGIDPGFDICYGNYIYRYEF